MTDVFKYVVRNRLDEVFSAYCHLPEGIRYGAVSQYTPSFKRRFGTRRKCPYCKYGIMMLKDQNRAVWQCCTCGHTKNNYFRFNGPGKQTGRLDLTPKRVLYHCYTGRAFYSTLGIFDPEKIRLYDSRNESESFYYGWKTMNAFNLALDIDLKPHVKTTIANPKNSAAFQKVLDFIKDKLSCCENNINLQTSGNGIYVILHHSLCEAKDDIQMTAAKFRLFMELCNSEMEEKGLLKRVKIDTHLINLSSQVFKLAGSLHQEYDLVAIPLDYDVDLRKINWHKEAHPSNFSMKNFIVNERMTYYNRKDPSEKKDFFKMLDETFNDTSAIVNRSFASFKLTYKDKNGNDSGFFTTELNKDKSYKSISMATMYNYDGKFTTNTSDPNENEELKKIVDRIRGE